MSATYLANNGKGESIAAGGTNPYTFVTTRQINSGEHVVVESSIQPGQGPTGATAITVGSLTLTLDGNESTANGIVQIWSGRATSNIASGSTVSITLSSSPAGSFWRGAICISLSGVLNDVSPNYVETSGVETGTGANPTVSTSAAGSNGNCAVGALMWDSAATPTTTGAGFTQRDIQNNTGWGDGTLVDTKDLGSTSVQTDSWTLGGIGHSSLVVVYKADSPPVSTGVLTKDGLLLAPTVTGNQVVSGLTFRPTAVIFYTVGHTVANNVDTSTTTGYRHCFGIAARNPGASDVLSQWCIANGSDGAAAATNAGRLTRTNACIVLPLSGTPTIDAIANIVSFNSDGFTINWSDAASIANQRVHWFAIGGSDITDATAGSGLIVRNTAGTETYTVGFQPDAVLLASEGVASGTIVDSTLSVGGFSVAGPTQAACAFFENDAAAAMDGWHSNSTTRAITVPSTTSVIDGDASFSAVTSTGFTLNWNDPVATASSRTIFWLALKGGQYRFVNWLTQVSGTLAVNTPFQAKGILAFAANTGVTANATDVHQGLSIGACDAALAQGVVSAYQHDADLNSQARRADFSNAVYEQLQWTTGTTVTERARYSITAIGASSFTLTTLTGVANLAGLAFVLGNAPSIYTDAATVRLSLTPSGLDVAAYVEASPYPAQVRADSPSSYWRMGSLGTVVDEVGAVTGTVVGPPALTTGLIANDSNQAILQDASVVQYVTLGDVYDFAGNVAFTAEAWIKPTTIDSGYRAIFEKRVFTPITDGWCITCQDNGAGGRLIAERDGVGGGQFAVSAGGSIVAGQTYHVTMTYDGTSIKLYINSVLAATGAANNIPISGNTGPLYIGSSGGTISTFIGTIDEVALYPTALSLPTIQTHYNLGTQAAAITLKFTPSGTETSQRVDSGTKTLALTPSGSEIYTGGGYSDAGSLALALVPTGSDIFAGVDASATTLTFTPSSTDAAVLVEAATKTLDLTPSGAEIAQYTDSGATTLGLVPSGADVYATGGDAATIALALTASGSDVIVAVETATVPLTLTPTSTDIRIAADSGTETLTLTASSTDVAAYADAATGLVALSPSGTDVLLTSGSDAGTIGLGLVPSSVDIVAYTDVNTVTVGLVASGTEISQFVDSSTERLVFTPSGAEAVVAADSGSLPFSLTPTGADTTQYTETSTTRISFTVSGLEGKETYDTNIGILGLIPSSTETFTGADANTGVLNLTPSSTDVASYYEGLTPVKLNLVPSVTEVASVVDSSTVPLKITVTSVEAATYSDTSTPVVGLTPLAGDIAQYTDTVTSRLSLIAGGSDIHLLVGYNDSATVRLSFSIYGPDKYIPYIIKLSMKIGRRFDVLSKKRFDVSVFNRWRLND